MKTPPLSIKRAFTLVETVVAIGVLAVLLAGFVIVFAPAAAGIKKAISVQEADRLTSTLEQELVTFRKETNLPTKTPPTSPFTGFDKAFDWIKKSNVPATSLLIYQYRGSLTAAARTDDGTPVPVPDARGKIAGKDYMLQTMVRRKNDTAKLNEDLAAVEGGVYFVRCTQLKFNTQNGQLGTGTPGSIGDPKGATPDYPSADTYPEAVITFTADFYSLPTKSAGYFTSGYDNYFTTTTATTSTKKPLFSRNLGVRR